MRIDFSHIVGKRELIKFSEIIKILTRNIILGMGDKLVIIPKNLCHV